MIEQKGNIWDTKANFICITTCGDVKSNGKLVMGKGIAKQAVNRYPGLETMFGKLVHRDGNKFQVTTATDKERGLIIFPTKHQWIYPSNLSLVQESLSHLFALATNYPESIFALPRPGCGAGGLGSRRVESAYHLGNEGAQAGYRHLHDEQGGRVGGDRLFHRL